MPKTRYFVTETTATGIPRDAFDGAFDALAIRGQVALRLSGPSSWASAVPEGRQLATEFRASARQRAIVLHLVERGTFELVTPRGGATTLLEGDIAVCMDGRAHVVSSGGARDPHPFANWIAATTDDRSPVPPSRPDDRSLPAWLQPACQDAEAATASLVCGVLLMGHADLNPLLDALPPIVVAQRIRWHPLRDLARLIELLRQALDHPLPGDGTLACRVMETLLAEALRVHIAAIASEEPGWIRGLRDPIVNGAMAAIHARPDEDWSVDRLAGLVSMSPSRFTVRFAETLGINPMAYATRWRMGVACRLLAATNEPLGRIAHLAGYGNIKAFERAFTRCVGIRPEAWRRCEPS